MRNEAFVSLDTSAGATSRARRKVVIKTGRGPGRGPAISGIETCTVATGCAQQQLFLETLQPESRVRRLG
jgi:hypothetical protein